MLTVYLKEQGVLKMNRQKRKKRKDEKQVRKKAWLRRRPGLAARPIDLQSAPQLGSPVTGDAEHAHEWVVFSTALADRWLMLQCVGCGLHAVVENPSEEEWKKAFHAPSRPYRWHDENRVVLKGFRSGTQRYVIPATDSRRCECDAHRGVLEPDAYERMPVEITRPAVTLTETDRKELEQLANAACKGSLCSHLLPLYLRCFEQDTGQVPGEAVQEMVRRIEMIDGKGLHCSPSVVSMVLRECVAQEKVRPTGSGS
jgi:hypothetical protein